ncbi:hypothetical protein TEA_024092 [Camellia sinensis var. sinensis]|uniref:Peptidase S9 prolyl oligopeptidase catalytic domain-containing protein n=1 Tax=Camellia sinensis var. sinensis TaxID=542762 RepID=A0A4S4EW35_CAMSN|nr:hypothetical protein TEA_024092 [Camellia sinensis var. sinensis]
MGSPLASSSSSSVVVAAATAKITAPYGSWKSPITADLVSGSEKRLEGFSLLHSQNRLIWLERSVLVREAEKPGDEPTDITPTGFSVQSTAQEYGGGAFALSGFTLIFSNFEDQRLYKQFLSSNDSTPVPLTRDYGGPVVRYADGVFDSHFNRYISVREDHRGNSVHPTTEIVSIDLSGENIQEPKVLVSGSDFYAFPRMDPKGERLAWIEWSHPNMHWDKAELWVGYISENGDIYKRICVAGADTSIVESPSEPKWSSKGELFFVTDRNKGFWNIHKWIEERSEVRAVYSLDAEFTRALWVFGISSYDFIQSNEQTNVLACSYRQNGRSYLGVIDQVQNSLSAVDVPFTYITNIISGDNCLYIEGASATHPLSLAKVVLNDQKSNPVNFQIIWSCSSETDKYKSYFSSPKLIEFPTDVAGQNAYAYFYPPCNPHYQASQEEKPPLLLESHVNVFGSAYYACGIGFHVKWFSSPTWPVGWPQVVQRMHVKEHAQQFTHAHACTLVGAHQTSLHEALPLCEAHCAMLVGRRNANRGLWINVAVLVQHARVTMAILDTHKRPLHVIEAWQLGGPTDEAHGILNLNIQYWTSRGWSFVDVNYGGSTGYGREYRERLLGSWGIVDVNDCCSCAKYLVDDGKVDGERICITGCSAGGYTTLASLAFRETFKAGASLFGIADLNSLRAEMHKFESHYISNLVGGEEALFERSPINFVDKFSCPIILFQGLEDKVVQPEQARKIYMALKKKGLPVALVEYEGEPHGFRKADNIKFTLEQQMVFFARTVGHFTVADEIVPIQIHELLFSLLVETHLRNLERKCSTIICIANGIDDSSGCNLGLQWWTMMATMVDHDLGYSDGKARSKVRVLAEEEKDDENEEEEEYRKMMRREGDDGQ